MNAYGVVILAALLGEYAVNRIADVLNLRALGIDVPEEFEDVYDADTYQRTQEYTRVRTRFGFVPATIELFAILVVWFAGGFALLDDWARDLGLGPIWTGLAFIGVLLLGKTILSLPFDYYSTFVIEERFGFNRSTRGTFWADVLKGILLGIALGGPLLAAILAFFEWAGPAAWLYCWIVSGLFVLLIQLIAPTWIMPLFNRFTPLEEGELREKVLGYAEKVGFPLEGMFVIDGSRRSTKANAFFTGFGRHKRIALFDTLIEKHGTDELLAVVAHEIGHYKRKHILQGTAISIAHLGVIFGLLAVFLRQEGLFAAFGIDQPSVYAGLVLFGLLFAPVELVLSFLMQAFSRRNEYEADRFAAETTGLWRDLAKGLKRLSADNRSNLTPHPFYVALHHSHPPVLLRIDALRRAAQGGS